MATARDSFCFEQKGGSVWRCVEWEKGWKKQQKAFQSCNAAATSTAASAGTAAAATATAASAAAAATATAASAATAAAATATAASAATAAAAGAATAAAQRIRRIKGVPSAAVGGTVFGMVDDSICDAVLQRRSVFAIGRQPSQQVVVERR